jgi:hypothetical protein
MSTIRSSDCEVIVNLGDRANGRSRIGAGGLLFDRNGGREPVDQVDVGLLHLLEELAGIGGQRLDVAPLSLGVDRVEGERRLAGAGQARDHDQLVARQIDVYVLEVVDARTAYRNPVVRHRYNSRFREEPKRLCYRRSDACRCADGAGG